MFINKNLRYRTLGFFGPEGDKTVPRGTVYNPSKQFSRNFKRLTGKNRRGIKKGPGAFKKPQKRPSNIVSGKGS
jgi:hypothetical protein